jgi:hypothetical protein
MSLLSLAHNLDPSALVLGGMIALLMLAVSLKLARRWNAKTKRK